MTLQKKNLIIAASFALAHGLCCIVCRSLNTQDSFVLTLLTIAMLFIICYNRRIKLLYIFVAVFLAEVFAYIMGNALPKVLCLLMGDTMWTYALSTLITTLVIGFCTELFCSKTVKKPLRSRWIVHINDRIVPVNTEQIAYFISQEKYNYLVTKDGVRYIVDSTMDAICSDLDPAQFFRISRGCILSLSCIDSVVKDAGRYCVQTHPETDNPMVIARAKVDDFLNWLA